MAYTSPFTEYHEDYMTKDLTVVYQGIRFFMDFNTGTWHYNGKPCTKDMSKILSCAKEQDDAHYSKYQAII